MKPRKKCDWIENFDNLKKNVTHYIIITIEFKVFIDCKK